MKRVFHRRAGGSTSSRAKGGAGALPTERTGSFGRGGRQQGEQRPTPVTNPEAAPPASDASTGAGEAVVPAPNGEVEQHVDLHEVDHSGGRDDLRSALERHAAQLDEPSQPRASVAALIKSIDSDEVSYQDVRHMVALLDWAGRQEMGERHALAASVRATLFGIFSDIVAKHGARVHDAPSITFDLTRDGFACLQVPEVVIRGSGSSQMNSASGGAPSLSSIAHGTKVWPPPDGYSVSIWFRVDNFERKAERDALYRDCFISKKCVHCLRPLEDERMLKCSHAGCRACVDALLSAGGECSVCNPPSFYLFRFRSGDGKSISEAFLRGGKIYMRTSTNSHQVAQFRHSAITPGRWYHAVILHSKQRFQSSSASLYLNGVLQETVKCSYPSSVILGQPLSGVIGVPAKARRRSTTRLQIGPFYLIEDPLSGSLINALFAAGPAYDKLFFGTTGSADVRVALDHLQLPNMAMLDEYMRDPVQELIDSVDTERIAKSSFIRGGLSLASAASATAAAIVHDMKWSGSWFSRIPSAAPCISIPIVSDKVLLAFSPSKAIGSDPLLVPSGKLDGRPISQAMGGASTRPYFSMANMMFEFSGSGCQLAYKLLHEATSSTEVETSLRILRMLMTGHPDNLAAMEKERGYGIVKTLLHRKSTLLNSNCLRIVFGIVGVNVDQASGSEGEKEEWGESEWSTGSRSIITNIQALQHFVLDFSLWRKAEHGTRKQLFVLLYSSLVAANDDGVLERNRMQFQSVSFLKQLLQELLEPSVDFDVLQVIADLILVCLTTYRGSAIEDNFAEVAGFLTTTLSPSFGRSFAVLESPRALNSSESESPRSRIAECRGIRRTQRDDPVESLGLSPRGASFRRRNGSLGLETSVFEYVQADDAAAAELSEKKCANMGKSSISERESGVAIVQNMLLDVLLRAVQKLDLKGSRKSEDSSSSSSVNETITESNHGEGGITSDHTSASTSVSTSGSRMQLPTASRLSGFRKVLSPRWVSHFLLPAQRHSSGYVYSPILHPTTILRALKLFGTLVKRHSYEAVCRREHYYRLLAHGLPCRPDQLGSDSISAHFPLQEAWYALLCMILGTPVDGVPHQIQFDPYFLSKDFEGNIRRNIVSNPSMLTVMMTIIRRYYNDPVAIASLPRLTDSRSWDAYNAPINESGEGFTSGDSEVSTCHRHEAALDFVAYFYGKMPCIRGLLVSSSGDRFRHDVLDELSLVACAAARSRVVHNYAPKKAKVLRALLSQKKEANLYEYTLCRVTLAEEAAAAAAGPSGEKTEDPFAHPVADRALKLLEAILMDILLDSSNGSEIVEAFFENTITAGGGLSPPLHSGLSTRFHAVVLSRLVDQVGQRLRDDSVLVNHKAFEFNCREFLRLAVRKMQCWQRAQHGDGCPAAFRCCETYHFAGGQFHLLNLALFVLAETSVGISGSAVASSSSSLTSGASTPFSVMLSDKFAKGKKKRPLRNLLGRIGLPRSAELEALTSELYSTLNAVILHIFNGHRVIISDAELEAALHQMHTYREVVLGSRNNLDKDFFVCLCRGLLQLLMDTSAPQLQDAAAHLWTDLMFFQRSFMTSLLVVEIRRSGASPYSVNLMKNGFDVLLEPRSANGPSSSNQSAVDANLSAVAKLTKWLQVVGPPLRELENNLDRVFMKRVMESTESIRDAWAAHHKAEAQQISKFSKRFDARLAWSQEVMRSNLEALRAAQQKEFRHQAKWRQDSVDRQKYNLRQLQIVEQHFSRAVFDDGGEVARGSDGESSHRAIGKPNITERSVSRDGERKVRLDFTEGPHRMRKRLTLLTPSLSPTEQTRTDGAAVGGSTDGSGQDEHGGQKSDWSDRSRNDAPQPLRKAPRSLLFRLLRRRYSAGDADMFRGARNGDKTALSVRKHPSEVFQLQLSDATATTRWTGDKLEIAQHSSRTGAHTASHPLHLLSSGDSLTSDDISISDGAFSDDIDSQKAAAGPTRSGETGIVDGRVGGVAPGVETEDTALFDKDEELVDEKLRPLLIPGDDVEDIHDCLRIDGMDSCPGVFLLCSDRVYIIDNYQKVVQRTLPPLLSTGNEAPHQQIRVAEVAKGSTTRLERRLGLHNRVALMRSGPSMVTTAGPNAGSSYSLLPAMSHSEFTTHQCRNWAYEDVTELHKRRYQLQHIAIELFANDGRNYLITFESREERELVFHALLNRCPNVRRAANGLDRAAAGGGDLYSQLRKLLRNNMTERWVQGSISNFEYLMHLNTLAGRSYNDLTQYPVFPWILADYTSEELDLSDPSVYRDLSKPMGALFREEEFRTRYDSLVESALSINATCSGNSSGGGSGSSAATITPAVPGATSASSAAGGDDPLQTKPFHYGTHYSSAAITLHYLMRLEPFTTHFRNLHDGKFDHADRLFASIHGAWKSAAGVEGAQNGGTQDVKELIPEFFYLPAFLKNINSCDFGRDQNGVDVGDVALPPWANGSPAEFVRLNREALESTVVSASLHHWIDLIFGYKQQGPAAVEACNVFYHLTYEGAVDLDAIQDTATKRAIVAQIAEFGQTPSQLFKSPHPARSRSAIAASGVGSGSNGIGSSFLLSSIGSFGNSAAPSTLATSSFHASTANSMAPTSSPGGGNTMVSMSAPSPLTARSLASSFLEGGELMNRMQTIISGAGSGSNGGTSDDQALVLDQAPLLQAERRREVPANAVLAANRSQLVAINDSSIASSPTGATSPPRRRLLSSGLYASSIHRIAMISGGVERRVVALGPNCLFLPPRNTEFIAWGFQDGSLKILSTGSSESGHGNDSKVLASIDIPFGISVAAISSDGRTLITGSGDMPVMRVWRLEPHRRPTVPSLSASAVATRRRYTTSSSFSPLSTRIAGGGGIGSSGIGGSSGTSSGGVGGLGISMGSHSAPKSLMVVATVSSPAQGGCVTAIGVSREFSIFVSGCSTGVAVLWDLNRRRVLRSLPSFDSSGTGVAAVEINEVTGDIVVAVGERFGVYDVNGALRVRLDYTTLFHDPKLSRAPIVSLALERLAACEWRAEKRVVTGHADGVLCVWAYVSAGAGGGFGSGADEDDDEWTLELQARHIADTKGSGSALTAVYLSADERKLWSGSADGVLFVWTPRPTGSPAMAPTAAVPLPTTP